MKRTKGRLHLTQGFSAASRSMVNKMGFKLEFVFYGFETCFAPSTSECCHPKHTSNHTFRASFKSRGALL